LIDATTSLNRLAAGCASLVVIGLSETGKGAKAIRRRTLRATC